MGRGRHGVVLNACTSAPCKYGDGTVGIRITSHNFCEGERAKLAEIDFGRRYASQRPLT